MQISLKYDSWMICFLFSSQENKICHFIQMVIVYNGDNLH